MACAPLAARADDTASTSTPDPSAVLGPSAGSGAASSSSADGSALQPTVNAPLQSTTGDGGGLTAPNSSTLQAPATSNDNLRVLAGEADGAPHQAGDDTTAGNWGWLWFSLLIGLIAAGTFIVLRDRRRFRAL
jgi:hypothetical protein